MPTGYTHAVKDGITFEQFVWSCARGMGALVMMRDEPMDAPIPERFEASDYHAREADKARAELTRLLSMTIEQVQAQAETAYQQACTRHAEIIQERTALRNKYAAMLAKAVLWNAPTADHEPFKEFMVSQLRQSIDFDCNTSYYKEPVRQDATAWHNAQIAEQNRQIAYHEKSNAEEVERVESRNAWLKALRESLAATQEAE